MIQLSLLPMLSVHQVAAGLDVAEEFEGADLNRVRLMALYSAVEGTAL